MKQILLLPVVVTLILISGCIQDPSLDNLSPIPTIQPETTSPSNTEVVGQVSPTQDKTPFYPATETSQIKSTNSTKSGSPTITRTVATSTTISPSPSRTAQFTLGPDGWKYLPVIPIVSEKVVDIYEKGLELGNDPHAFSKIGDCGSTPTWFLGDFDRGSKYYRLGEYQDLADVIEEFKGSFDRTSLAARSGFNASALFTPLWSDLTFCQPDETPLACEYRIHRPVIAFIMLGSNDVWQPKQFEPQMRKIIEYSIQSGVVPILSTKADNQERDHSINSAICRLALEYDIPLWNFWRAVDPLPGHGLQADLVHLTWGGNLFDDPDSLSQAWTMRNLTALLTLDAIWRKVTDQR